MGPMVRGRRLRRIAALALVAGVGLASSGCVMSRGEFAQPASEPVVLTGGQPQDIVGTPADAKPAVAAQQEPQSAPPLALSATGQAEPPTPPVAPATLAAADGNAPPAEPNSKLLSPEEKTRVIAELEALAKSQGARAAADKARCEEEAAKALDPEQRLRRDLAGGGC